MKSHSGLSRFVARLTSFRTAIVGAACIGMLAACGVKGPLYMPEGEPGYQAATVNSTGTSSTVTHPANVPSSGSSNTK